MDTISISWIRRLGRMAEFILLGHSHVIITVPLSVGLLTQSLITFYRGTPWMDVQPTDIVRSIGLRVAILLFTILALMHLVTAAYVGWKGNGRDLGS